MVAETPQHLLHPLACGRGAMGWLFLPPPLVFAPCAVTPCLHQPWWFQRYCKKGRKEGEGGERLKLCGEPVTIRAEVNC